MLSPSCVLPEDATFTFDTLPERKNRPPRILQELVQPPQRRVTLGNGLGCNETFVVTAVEDPDVDDLLTVDWYIDYDPSDPSPAWDDDAFENSGKPLRDQPVELFVNPNNPGHPLAVPGVHVLEAVVSDGRLVQRIPQPRPHSIPDAGVNATYAVSHAWTIVVVPEDCL